MAEDKQFSADTVADEYYKIEAFLRTETPDSLFHARIYFAYWRLQTEERLYVYVSMYVAIAS